MTLVQQQSWGPVTGFRFGWSPFGTPNLCSHVYFVDSVLIDTGHSRMAKAVQMTVGTLPVQQIFITHHHEDHTGNLAALRARFACPTYASARCCELMKKPPSISLVQWLHWGNRPADNDLQVTPTVLETEQYSFELIPTPGHAPDMVALYEPNEGWLFSADLYVHHRINYLLFSESIAEQIASIKKVLALDFEHFFCSHNGRMRLPKTQLAKKLAFLEDYYGRVAHAYHQGKSIAETRRELSLREDWFVRIASHGYLSQRNMIAAVIRDEQHRTANS